MSNIHDQIISSERAEFTTQEKLHQTQLNDLTLRLKHRKILFYWIIIVLTIQNIVVYFLFYKSINDMTNAKYAAFSVLISGTLLATYGALKIIVQWLFKDSSYKLH